MLMSRYAKVEPEKDDEEDEFPEDVPETAPVLVMPPISPRLSAILGWKKHYRHALYLSMCKTCGKQPLDCVCEAEENWGIRQCIIPQDAVCAFQV